MRKAGFIYQSGFWFCFYLMWYLLVGPSMKLHNSSFWGLYFMVIIEGEKVLICFHSLIIYLTFQHHYSPNCKLYKKISYDMSCCEFITENLLTITGITPNTDLDNPNRSLLEAISLMLSSNTEIHLKFLFPSACPVWGPHAPQRWLSNSRDAAESFSPKSSGFPWFKNKWW